MLLISLTTKVFGDAKVKVITAVSGSLEKKALSSTPHLGGFRV